ncbi:MAG: hypothetical protein E7354_02300 [Clostridiales bacterium]|nr:hypothetical protein [Clostridiales bacterium]
MFGVNFMANTIFGSIIEVFNNLGTFAGGLEEGLQMILFVSLGLFVLGIAICLMLIGKTYESKLLKSVTSFNRYFKKNPYINEDNLVEVNSKFKQVPKTLRHSWHEYMLNRDRQPSEYINTVSCIDQPTRSSAYKNISNTVLFITIMIAVITFFANLVCNYALTVGVDTTQGDLIQQTMTFDDGIFPCLLMPLLYLFIGSFIVTVLKLMESSRYADLYFEFHEFERYLDKACSTMPSFVDYEVLFTPKEIREAIPVLQEYLEKRAALDQKEAEEAELNSNHFENFDFDPVGVESALLLDRAMLEGEKYFNFKRGLTERITSKEQEKFNFQKKFDEVTKEYDRKSQAVRENMTSLTDQLNATSVKIEANYLKKRLNEEQQKQQQLEKDYEYAQINFTKQQQEMEAEIAQLTAEIKDKKAQVEANMMSECRNYSNKVWGEINKTLTAQQEPIVREKEERAAALQEEIDKMTILVADQDADIRAKQDYILKLEQDIKTRLAEIEAINNVRDYFNTPEFRQRVSDKKKRRKPEEYEEFEPSDNSLARIVTTADPVAQIQQDGNQLLDKLKEVNMQTSPYAEELVEIKERERVKDDKANNPFAAFTNIQNDIEKENQAYINNQNDLANSINTATQAVQTPVQPAEKKPESKASKLQGLLDSAKKIKK